LIVYDESKARGGVMAKGILRRIRRAAETVGREISAFAGRGHIAGGLASEGYAGGYRDALWDVEAMLRGTFPCRRPEYWNEEREG